jgi:hypothetical protein
MIVISFCVGNFNQMKSGMKTKTERTQRITKSSTHNGVYEYNTQALFDELELEEDWKKLYKQKNSRRN